MGYLLLVFHVTSTQIVPIPYLEPIFEQNKKLAEPLILLVLHLAGVVGLEPTTNGFGVRYSAYFGIVQPHVNP